MVKRINLKQIKDIPFCVSYMIGKQHCLKFPKQAEHRAQHPLYLIHSDIKGPFDPTHIGFKYFITFIDDFSRYTITYLLKLRSQALTKFQEYKAYSENFTNQTIKFLSSNGSGEHIFDAFKEFCLTNGIQQQITTPYTPKQNGVTKRKNCTLIEAILSMLYHTGFTKSYWGEALLTTNYLQNTLPTKALDNITPYEIWYGHKPNLSYLKVFGCIAYVHRPKETRQKSKLESKSLECWFLGYEDGIKGYHLQDKSSKQIIMFRDVIFRENQFH